MKFLAIETSCDETALSVIESNENLDNLKVLSDLVISQIDVHRDYGGVFPQLAKREHAKNLTPLLQQSLQNSNQYYLGSTSFDSDSIRTILEREPETAEALIHLLTLIEQPDIDAIIVTQGPGLAPALWVGINFARALSQAWNIPIIPVNHMEGHITSILFKNDYMNQDNALLDIQTLSFPMIALLISGGHTQLVLVRSFGDYEIIGETIDDAVGEAFDKVARMMGLPYPGGPEISKYASKGQAREDIQLPRPMITSKDYRFSFSGLKTAARYLIESLQESNQFNEQTIADIAREFQEAVTEVLIKKTKEALIEYNAKGLIIAGGVSANKHIINNFSDLLEREFDNIDLYTPQGTLSGDNALMIASAGLVNYKNSNKKALTPQDEVKAISSLKLYNY